MSKTQGRGFINPFPPCTTVRIGDMTLPVRPRVKAINNYCSCKYLTAVTVHQQDASNVCNSTIGFGPSIMEQRGNLRLLARIREFHLSYF